MYVRDEIQSRFRSIAARVERNLGYLLPGKEGQVEKRRNCSRSIWKSPLKVKSGRFSRACRYSTAKKAARLFLLLVYIRALFCIFMKSLWAARSKRLGLVAWMCWELHFRWYRERCKRDVHRDVVRTSLPYGSEAL